MSWCTAIRFVTATIFSVSAALHFQAQALPSSRHTPATLPHPKTGTAAQPVAQQPCAVPLAGTERDICIAGNETYGRYGIEKSYALPGLAHS